MNPPISVSSTPGNGASTPHDLFALTDEQILEIAPEGEVNIAPGFSPASPPNAPSRDAVAQGESSSPASQENNRGADTPGHNTADVSSTDHGTRATEHAAEPPPWLAAQMNDPWTGQEARDLWQGVQQAQSEAAAYRAAIATPEDARTLKELYPGGVAEARATAERARVLQDIDRAYFGLSGGTPEQATAARAELAQRMLREDPEAFREMVFAGLRALEAAEKGSAGASSASYPPRPAQLFGNRDENHSVAGAQHAAPLQSSANNAGTENFSSTEHGSRNTDHGFHQSSVTSHQSLSAYAAFEKAANDDLERSVGATITRTLERAIPNLSRGEEGATAGARSSVPLQERLGSAIREDVEAALKGDRQLGEQIAQILSARRFDSESRAQVVRLIDDRAQQLVPIAAKRVLQDWTQATLTAHRGHTARANGAFRPDLEPAIAPAPSHSTHGAVAQGESASPAASSSAAASWRGNTNPRDLPAGRQALPRATPRNRGLDYRKLSDEQILEL